jgi:hypothetical protein
MCRIEKVTNRTFVNDVEHKAIHPQGLSAPPAPPVIPPLVACTTRFGSTSSSRPSKDSSGLLKVLKGSFAICQNNKHDFDVARAKTSVVSTINTTSTKSSSLMSHLRNSRKKSYLHGGSCLCLTYPDKITYLGWVSRGSPLTFHTTTSRLMLNTLFFSFFAYDE